MPQIEVNFELTADGILDVSAIEKGTGKSEKITITNDKGRLSQQEIDKMVSDAEKYKQEDDEKRELVDAKNNLESAAFSLKNLINGEQGKSLPDDKKSELEQLAQDTIVG